MLPVVISLTAYEKWPELFIVEGWSDGGASDTGRAHSAGTLHDGDNRWPPDHRELPDAAHKQRYVRARSPKAEEAHEAKVAGGHRRVGTSRQRVLASAAASRSSAGRRGRAPVAVDPGQPTPHRAPEGQRIGDSEERRLWSSVALPPRYGPTREFVDDIR